MSLIDSKRVNLVAGSPEGVVAISDHTRDASVAAVGIKTINAVNTI